MGCDIHAMWERKRKYENIDYSFWVNAGTPDTHRNYELFAILGDVRNDDGIPYIGSCRFNLDGDYWYEEEGNECSSEFAAYVKHWDMDGHSHSWVSLKELKEYDINQTYHSSRLICSKDEDGNITSTCAWSSAETLGEVGETTPFGLWGSKDWDDLIADGEAIRERYNLPDDEVRLVFFFDN